jgi:PAS domain S-box-containing protein
MPWMTRDKTLALVVATITATFVGDLVVELGVAASVPYVLPVVASLWLRSLRATLLVALITTGLTLLGLLLSPSGGEEYKVLLNRAYGVIAIWSVAAAALIGAQLKQAQESLEEAEQTLAESSLEAAVFRAAGDPTQAIGLDGRIVALNAAGARLVGVSAEEVVGMPARAVAQISRAGGTRYAESESLVALVLADGQERSAFGDTITRRDGSRVEIDRTISPMVDATTGTVMGVVQVMRDVTSQRQIERAKSEFLAMTSHELKTPLTAIHAAVGLAASGQIGELPDKVGAMLKTAQVNSERLLLLVQEIVDLETLTLGRVKLDIGLCNSRELEDEVATALIPVAEQSNVLITVEADPIRFDGDHRRIVQALVNLTANAIKFAPASSTVTLRSMMIGHDVTFEVQDEGPGIIDSDLERIFEKFQQVDNTDTRVPGGNGLGLAITKGIVEQHGGRVWAERGSDKGSVFRFTIPQRA